jgi:hypothetical protein
MKRRYIPITEDPREFASDYFLGISSGDVTRFYDQPKFNRNRRKADADCVAQGYILAEVEEYNLNMYRPDCDANLRVEKPRFFLTDDDKLRYSLSHGGSCRLRLGFWVLLLAFCGAIIWVFAIKELISWLP